MNVFIAMLIDSYRELNSKRLFWVILALSGVVVIFFGSIGFDEKGMSMLFGLFHNESEFLTADSPISRILYRSIFATFMVGIWLAWIATILALISTTTIFPDFVAGGAIDMVLSKPIGRVRLFVLKYVTSLLFVLLQVTIFCVGIFLCMGLRLGDWDWRVFLAIPIVLAFFSYLFAFNVLIGVWSRSAITALLLTLLFWFSLYGTAQAEAILLTVRMQFDVQQEGLQDRIEAIEATPEPERASNWQGELTRLQSDLEERAGTIETLAAWEERVWLMRLPLPKTGETIGLLDRWLRRDSDVNLMDIFAGNIVPTEDGGFRAARGSNDDEASRRIMEIYEARSGWLITGTSLGFEAVILLIAGWIFVRRDY